MILPSDPRPPRTAYPGDRPLRKAGRKEPNMMPCCISSSTRTAASTGGRASAPPTSKLAAGGPFWGQQDSPTAGPGDETLTIANLAASTPSSPTPAAPGQSLTLLTDTERVVLPDRQRQTIASRTSPPALLRPRPVLGVDAPAGRLLSSATCCLNYITTRSLAHLPPGVHARGSSHC